MLKKKEGCDSGGTEMHNLKTQLQRSLEILGLQDQQGGVTAAVGKGPCRGHNQVSPSYQGQIPRLSEEGVEGDSTDTATIT